MSNGDPARLIPVAGIQGDHEAEQRAASALLAVMTIVRPFSTSLLAHVGATKAATARVEAFTEPTYDINDRTVRPDALIEVHVSKRVAFTALAEVKTGLARLDADQINTYLDIARREGIDCVVTISNEIAPSPGVHPTEGLSVRANSKVAAHHLSWTLILSEAVKEHAHRGVDDPEQAWILNELIRYLTHPKSGVLEFSDMGEHWTKVRDAATGGTLNRSDVAVVEVCQRWDQLLRVAALRLGTETGAEVIEVIPKAHRVSPRLRSREFVNSLCNTGTLSGVLRVPASAGDMTVTADIRASIVEVSAMLTSPQEGTPRAAVIWLIKQLRDAPDELVVDTYARNARSAQSETLGRLCEEPLLALGGDRRKHPARFCVRQQSPMGEGRRTRRKPGFIDSVLAAVIDFYGGILQDITPYTPRVPHIARPTAAAGAVPDSEDTDSAAADGSGRHLAEERTQEANQPPATESATDEEGEEPSETSATAPYESPPEPHTDPSDEPWTGSVGLPPSDVSYEPEEDHGLIDWQAINSNQREIGAQPLYGEDGRLLEGTSPNGPWRASGDPIDRYGR